MTHGFDHLRTAGVDGFIVNTHWHPEAYDAAFPEDTWRGIPIMLRHETILLETAGGIADVADLLRRTGHSRSTTAISSRPSRSHQPSPGISARRTSAHSSSEAQAPNASSPRPDPRPYPRPARPARLRSPDDTPVHRNLPLPPGVPRLVELRENNSSRTIFLDLIRAGRPVGGVVIDEGLWLDLGDRAAYLEAHRLFPNPDGPVPPPAGVVVAAPARSPPAPSSNRERSSKTRWSGRAPASPRTPASPAVSCEPDRPRVEHTWTGLLTSRLLRDPTAATHEQRGCAFSRQSRGDPTDSGMDSTPG